MTPKSTSFAASLLMLLATSCAKHEDDAGANLSSASSVSYALTDSWLGQWNGPEGTFLRIDGGQGQYQITIQNLDGPRQFLGLAVDDQIQFKRDGEQQVIRATDGAATGMKWLLDKPNCLTIRSGEGYCRE